MVTCCQTCGVSGCIDLLVYCSECRIYAEHRYCMARIPSREEVDVNWLCEQCEKRSLETNRSCNEEIITDIKKFQHHEINCTIEPDVSSVSVIRLALKPDVSEEPCRFNMIGELRMANRSDLVQKQVENTMDSSSAYIRNKNTKRRKLILDDEDEEEGEIRSDHSDPGAGEERKMKVNEPILESSSEHVQHARNGSHDMQELGHMETSDAQMNIACEHTYTKEPFYSPARPIHEHIWRGCFKICNEVYGPLRAHLSNRACLRVCELAKLLPPVLHMEKLSRLDGWPNSFRRSPPTDDSIGLYFLPVDSTVASTHCRLKSTPDQLLDDVINKDFMLKITFDDAELLVFSSVILPEEYHRFHGKYYPWGAFKGRQVPVPSIPPNCSSKSSRLTEEKHKMEGSNIAAVGPSNAESSGCFVQDRDDASSSRSFKLFGMQVSARSSSFPPSKQKGRIEDTKHMDDAKSSNSVSRFGSAPSFFQPLRLFGLDIPQESQEEHTMEGSERPDATDEIGSDDEYIDFYPKGETGWETRDAGEDGPCLELFRLRAEDMAYSSRVGDAGDVDVELTVSWRYGKKE